MAVVTLKKDFSKFEYICLNMKAKIIFMLGPYIARKNGSLDYLGNKKFRPFSNVRTPIELASILSDTSRTIDANDMWVHVARINDQINRTVQAYFQQRGALFTLLPLTTRMISSPGALYGREKISYTSDTCPIKLDWFDLPEKAFLAESSQLYLEMALSQPEIDEVYAVYSSFRKESADPTHVPEFHHVEFEGKVTQRENEGVALGLVQRIVLDLLQKQPRSVEYFLESRDISSLEKFGETVTRTPRVPFREALQILRDVTGDSKYAPFTMANFGAWEEVKLTEILDGPALIVEYPLLEVPFYHAPIPASNPVVADNADFIWPGYREVIGSGQRVKSRKDLEEKARTFELPEKDYEPYLRTRHAESYVPTAGFGLGWERLLQGILKTPFIWSTSQFPRINTTLTP